jgi:hydrogenase-4 component E
MNSFLNVLIGLAIGLNLVALGTGRLQALIRVVALQGVILGAYRFSLSPILIL